MNVLSVRVLIIFARRLLNTVSGILLRRALSKTPRKASSANWYIEFTAAISLRMKKSSAPRLAASL